MDDDDIREALRRGDGRRALDLLARRYQREIYGRCKWLLHDADTAEDAMQQTLISAIKTGQSLAKVENFRPWLMRTANNKCIDMLRKSQRERRREQEPSPAQHSEPVDELLQAEYERAAIEECLEHLEYEDRIAVVARVIDGWTWEEVGRALGVAPDTIRMRLTRGALRSLRECLESKEIRS